MKDPDELQEQMKFQRKSEFLQLLLSGSPGPSEYKVPCLLMMGPLWWEFGKYPWCYVVQGYCEIFRQHYFTSF